MTTQPSVDGEMLARGRRRWYILLALVVAVVAIIMTVRILAGGGDQGTQAATLSGHEWKLITVDGRAVGHERSLTMVFHPGGEWDGDDQVNHFTGTYRAAGAQLHLEQHSTTTAGYADGAEALAQPGLYDVVPVFAPRSPRDRYQVEGGRLIIDGNGTTLVFVASDEASFVHGSVLDIDRGRVTTAVVAG